MNYSFFNDLFKSKINRGGRTVSCDRLCYAVALQVDNSGLGRVQSFAGSAPLISQL